MSIVIHDYVRETAGKGGAKPATKPATKPAAKTAAKPEKKSLLSGLIGKKSDPKIPPAEKTAAAKKTTTTTTTTTVVHTHDHDHAKGGILKGVKEFVAKKIGAK